MSVITDCLNKIIGLSQTNCSCFTDNIPVDAGVSRSGLFLDQLDGLNLKMADSLEDCEEGGLWDILAKSRDNAIFDFRSDLMTKLMSMNKYKRQPFIGQIGTTETKGNKTLNKTYAGVEFYMDQIIGGTMEVRRIGLYFSETKTFKIWVYSNEDDSLLHEMIVSSVANQVTWVTLSNPIVLEMNNNSGSYPRYYFVYKSADASAPKDIQAGCGCSPRIYHYYWDAHNPKFKSYEKDRWSEFIMVTGVQGDDIADRENWATENYLNGLMFDVSFKCRVKDIICTEVPDYETNELAIAMAYAVRFKAGQLLLDQILASGNINRFSMMDRERMMGKKNTYVKEYLLRLDWLAENINIKTNDCLICNDTNDIFKAGILS